MRRYVAALLLVLPLAACGGGDEGEEGTGSDEAGLTVLAAASLTDVFQQLATPFEEGGAPDSFASLETMA